MTDVVIRVDGLGKQYRIGGLQRAPYRTIRETVADAVKAPFRRAARVLRGEPYGAAELDEIIWALKDVSFEVRRGEVVGIIGRNGAGKSTLLKILSRITEPTEGHAVIHGRVGSLLEVGTGFHPELTGRENLYLNGAILGMKKSEIERKFDEIVAFSEIEKFIDTPVKHYSSGMYVRLAFAVAAHLEPEILLVDEVLAVGDAAFQKKCLGKMGEVAGEGRTVLFVSHNMAAIVSLCQSAMWLEQGGLCRRGSPEKTVQSYLSTGTSQSASIQFDEAPEKSAQILEIQLVDRYGNLSTEFNVNTPIQVRVRYRLRCPLLNHRIGVIVSRHDGIEVFVTNSTDWQDAPVKALSGEYVATLHIPKFLLAPGHYLLTAYLGEPNIKTHDRYENILSFGISGNPFRLSEKRRGMLVYPFRWEVQAVSGV